MRSQVPDEDHAPVWTSPREGLPLLWETPGEWAHLALEHLDAVLVDHAHCEHKAASSALALIGRFPDDPGLVGAMIALAQEEIHHFRQVVDLIERRGGKVTRALRDPYVRDLRTRSSREIGGVGSKAEALLVCAFVEARSCERFRLLSGALQSRANASSEDRELAEFYRRLAAAEGRHWEVFRDLAAEVVGRTRVEHRIVRLAEIEAEVISSRPLEARMH